MLSKDWYKSFSELSQAEREGVDYVRRLVRRRSPIAIMAPHGGGIEPGTSELARAIAGWSYSCYTFDGVKQSGNELLHLTSTRFDDPKCISLLNVSSIVIALHGCTGAERMTYVGGAHAGLRAALVARLQAAGFEAQEASGDLAGNQPENLCNRGKAGRGVQLELTEALRRSMFAGLKREQRASTTRTFRGYVEAVRRELAALSK